MNQVLCVVGHQQVEMGAGVFFINPDVLVDPVEAVGFRGGASVRTQRHVNALQASGNGAHGVLRLPVVRIDAGEDVVVAVANGGQVVLQHAADHLVLPPQRN